MSPRLSIGLDVGSTTVKAVVMDGASKVLWRDYQRHETRQAERAAAMLAAIEGDFAVGPAGFHLCVTGSGGRSLIPKIGGTFVQEVNSVSLTVRAFHPAVRSVIEIGGQDAKIIIFRKDARTGRMDRLPSMNDKCAGGTGAVIDKIAAKLGFDSDALSELNYDGVRLHSIAGKCGVFAETDINGLQKQGIPADQLMASLFEAIVLQNLTVLTRGNTLYPDVLLLGGPNRFVPGMQQAWRAHIRRLWLERETVRLPDSAAQASVRVPDDGHYYAAIGAVLHGRGQAFTQAKYLGSKRLIPSLSVEVGRTRTAQKETDFTSGGLDRFLRRFSPSAFETKRFGIGARVAGFLGLDCGSSSTKAVFLLPNGQVAAKAYRLSCGNPLDDTKAALGALQAQIENNGARIEVLGIATTGYAKDVLKCALNADAALVETVAHARAAVHYYPETDVVCDVGGQDIKLLMLAEGGRIRDFRLNSQCSAGNGLFLQSAARSFGIDVSDFAARAFKARRCPEFGYGCSVFMQSDIVNFQRQGWSPNEILAGLAAVLPKNIWFHVAGVTNLSVLGRRFLLQGGTQKNLAALRAQVEFIERKFAEFGAQATVEVHRHCGEAGAIGAALEARTLFARGYRTRFIGFSGIDGLSYRTYYDDRTKCAFCAHGCRRTFIDIYTGAPPAEISNDWRTSLIPVRPGEQRVVVGNHCDRGLTDDPEMMRRSKRTAETAARRSVNLVDYAARRAWRKGNVTEGQARGLIWPIGIRRRNRMGARRAIRIGMPRVLNMYTLAPFFSAYFAALGVPRSGLLFSDFTNDEMFKAGARRGAIDPCYPSKVCLAHISSLLTRKRPPNLVFFPMIDTLDPGLAQTAGSFACPTTTATPEVVKAALTGASNEFSRANVQYLGPLLNFDEPALLSRQLHEAFKDRLQLSTAESRHAVAQGYASLRRFHSDLRRAGAAALDTLRDRQRLGVVFLARPYHNDPGLNHGIPERIRAMGYPVLTPETLPLDDKTLGKLFARDLADGRVATAMSIDDVWKNAYSENTSRKIWAAKFVARHPNLVALEYSSFKCGHDAPAYSVLQRIVEQSGTPYFCFKDMDENRSDGAIQIRLQTMDYFLRRYREDMLQRLNKSGNRKTARESVENGSEDPASVDGPRYAEPNRIGGGH